MIHRGLLVFWAVWPISCLDGDLGGARSFV